MSTPRTRVTIATGLAALVLLLAFTVQPAHAALTSCDNPPAPIGDIERSWIRLQLPIPSVTTTCYEQSADDPRGQKAVYYVQDVASYIAGLYKFIVGAIGLIATLMVFYAGLRWLTAAGNRGKVQEAKETLFSAVIAVVLALGSYTLLYTINPKLVNLRVPTLTPISGVQLQVGNGCSTQRVCLSGQRSGIACTADIDCTGAGPGACGFPVNLGTDRYPQCGKSYAFRTDLDFSSTRDSCIGTECESSVDVCGSIDNPKAGVVEGSTCVDPEAICEKLTDDIDAVSSDCQKYTVANLGKCAWDEPVIDDDQCFWYPRVQCGANTTQVGCGVCNVANAASPIPAITVNSNGAGVTIDSDAVLCEANSSDNVYADEESQDGKYKAICCQNTSTNALMYITNYLQTIKSGPDYP